MYTEDTQSLHLKKCKSCGHPNPPSLLRLTMGMCVKCGGGDMKIMSSAEVKAIMNKR